MKRFKAQKTYFALVMLILGVCVLLIAGCGGSGTDLAALVAAQTDSKAPGTCPASVGPFVDSSNITDGDISVALLTTITADFSEGMNTITGPLIFTLKVRGEADNVTGEVTMANENMQAIFTPTDPLAANTEYTATITKAATSISGGTPLSCSYRWSFTTGTSEVSSVN